MEAQPTLLPHRGWAFYIVLFCFVIAAALAVAVIDAAGQARPNEPINLNSALLSGDLNVRWALVGEPISHDPEESAQAAVDHYSRGLPSAVAHRRIGITKIALLGQPGLGDLLKTGGREAAMWRRVCSERRLSRDEAGEYIKFIRKLDLGPLRELAEAEVYARAGMGADARGALARAREAAYGRAIGLIGLFAVGALMGLAGVFLLGWLVRTEDGPNNWLTPGYAVAFPAFIAFLLAIVAFSVLAAAVAVEKKQPSLELALQGLVSIGSFVVGLRVLRERSALAGVDVRDIGLRLVSAGRMIGQGVMGYCAAIPVLGVALAVSVVLQSTLLRNFPTAEHPIVQYTAEGGLGLWLAFALAVVIAPVVEEIFFRGVLYGGLRNRMGVRGAAAFSGLLFASLHPTLPTGFLPILALGIVLALLREKTGSLYPGMVCHALNNAIMLALALLLY